MRNKATLFWALVAIATTVFAFSAIQPRSILAQDTPEATQVVTTGDDAIVTTENSDVAVTGNDTTVINTDTPDVLQPLAALGVGIFGLVEIIKNAGLSDAIKAWDDKKKALTYFLLATILSIGLLIITESKLDAAALLGYGPASTDIGRAVRIIFTGVAIAGGGSLWHVLYELRKRPTTEG